MKDLGDFAKMAAALPDALQKAQRRGIQQAALHVTRGIRTEIKQATGDNRLSGVGRGGARVGAKYDIKGTVNPTALISATGPLHLIERSTAPRAIYPKRKKALKMKNGGFAAHARHPGTPAKAPFAKGVHKTAPETGRIFDRQVQTAIRGVLK